MAERCRGNRRLEVRGGGRAGGGERWVAKEGFVEGRLVTQTPL